MQGAMNAVMTDGFLQMAAEKADDLSPGSLMSDVNNVLKPRMESGMNVTMVIGLINAETKTLTLASAVHHAYPLLLRDRDVQPLVAKGMPLGMMAGISYREVGFELKSGDVIVFMTDGIIEVTDSNGQDYADSGRLEHTIKGLTADMAAKEMIDAVIGDAIAYGGDKAEQEDNMTLVVVKIN